MSKVTIRLALAVSLVAPGLLFAQASKPSATKPTAATKPAATTTGQARRAENHARNAAVVAAIPALTKEVESAMRSGGDAPRSESSYFNDNPSSDLPPQAIIVALRRSGGDPRVSSYVKWQLLSGLPKELDEETTKDLIQIYRSSPRPIDRPGIDKRTRGELDRIVRNAKEDEKDRLEEQYQQMIDQTAKDNFYLLKYRDGLFAKLPPSFDALAAGFEDAVVRVDSGIDAGEHTRAVLKALPEWANNAPPEQLKQMSRALEQIQKKKGPEYYNKTSWSESTRKMSWTKASESLSGISQFKEAQEFIDDKIKNPTTPLKLKEEK